MPNKGETWQVEIHQKPKKQTFSHNTFDKRQQTPKTNAQKGEKGNKEAKTFINGSQQAMNIHKSNVVRLRQHDPTHL